ncbi:MAG: hypothetical protein ACLR4Z_07780 [Butyricicoccaceae bacterium]
MCAVRARRSGWSRNAEKVSSICNDVVGDICGIISGATGALIVDTYHLRCDVRRLKVAVSLLITGLVSALTIGGKAAGKGIAVCCQQQGAGDLRTRAVRSAAQAG